MEINSTYFSRKWDVMISEETEASHKKSALYNHVATIATAISVIALSILISVFFPELISFLMMGTVFALGPAIELGRHFLSNARKAQKLEQQSQKVRAYYQNFISKKESSPELKALSCHWKQKASEAEKEYKTLFEKAVTKQSEKNIPPFSLKNHQIEALQSEKKAATLKVYSLFLESLIGKETVFKRLFLKYGENLEKAVTEIGKWDEKEAETRAMNALFSQKDPVLTFYRSDIHPISYKELYQESMQEEIKSRIQHAVLRRETSLI